MNVPLEVDVIDGYQKDWEVVLGCKSCESDALEREGKVIFHIIISAKMVFTVLLLTSAVLYVGHRIGL